MQPTRTLAAVPQNYGFPMLSKWLTIPFALAALVFLFLAWEQDYQYAIYIVPSVVCLAVIYALSPQIDWWWYQKHPPELDPRLRKLLSDHLPFYQQLPAEGKQRFRQRVALFMIANEFIPKGMDSVPEDVKGFLAASAVQLTFGMENFLFDRFERIVVYPGPFPSPQYPRWHASELFEEDGVLLFSADHLMHAVRSPQKYFHLGMYEYGRALSLCYPDLQLPAPPRHLGTTREGRSLYPQPARKVDRLATDRSARGQPRAFRLVSRSFSRNSARPLPAICSRPRLRPGPGHRMRLLFWKIS